MTMMNFGNTLSTKGSPSALGFLWNKTVASYTDRWLTVPTDIFPTFSGIVSAPVIHTAILPV